MTLIELKKSIHERIDELEDPELLEQVNALLVQTDPLTDTIPEEHWKDIQQGIQDVKNGDFITLDEFETRYNSDLTKVEDKVFLIPDHMKNGIERANEDFKNGRVHTIDDFRKRYDKWLKD